MTTEVDEDDDWNDPTLDGWEDGDLAPRLLRANLAQIKKAIAEGPEALVTCLRGVVGHPPTYEQRESLELDTMAASEHAAMLGDNALATTKMLSENFSDEEIWAMIDALKVIDESETLAWELRGLRPVGPIFL